MCQDIHQTVSMSQILNAVKSQYAALFSQSNRKSVPVLVVTVTATWYNILSTNYTHTATPQAPAFLLSQNNMCSFLKL